MLDGFVYVKRGAAFTDGQTVVVPTVGYVLDAAWFVYTCRRLIDLSDDCRYWGGGGGSGTGDLGAFCLRWISFDWEERALRVKNDENVVFKMMIFC